MTGRVYPEQLPDLAAGLMLRGEDSPALRELAALDRPTRAEAEPVLERVLRERGAPPLDHDAACRTVAREIAARAVAGALQPQDAAAELSALCHECDWAGYLAWFAGALDEWDDVPGARADIAGDILRECRTLLESSEASA